MFLLQNQQSVSLHVACLVLCYRVVPSRSRVVLRELRVFQSAAWQKAEGKTLGNAGFIGTRH
jgi:hypothetical protein